MSCPTHWLDYNGTLSLKIKEPTLLEFMNDPDEYALYKLRKEFQKVKKENTTKIMEAIIKSTLWNKSSILKLCKTIQIINDKIEEWN